MPSTEPVTNVEQLENRLVDLEIRLTHQDDTLEALNDVVIQQQQQIDRLNDELAMARKRLSELDVSAGSGGEQAEPPPPHY